MCAHFVFRPHVETDEGMITPDLVIERLEVAGGENARFRLATGLLTGAGEIEVLGRETRAHAAVVLIAAGAGMLVGLGADHVDETFASSDPARARQLCAKPLARQCWRFPEIADHLDDVVLSAGEGGEMPLGPLRAQIREDSVERGGALLLSTGVTASGENVALALEDRRRGRRIELRYGVRVL